MRDLAAGTLEEGAVDRRDGGGAAISALDNRGDRQVTVQPWEHAFANRLQSTGADSLFVSPAWLGALTATYGFPIRASTMTVAGRVVAAIPYCEIDDLCGRRLVSLPFSDYADPFVDSVADWNALVAPLLAAAAPMRFRCLRNTIPSADPRFARHTPAVWHGADLRRSESETWAALSGSARQNIRRAETAGIRIRAGHTLGDVRTFYAMHGHVRKAKYRLFAQPFAFFESLHARFGPDRLIVLLAEADGTAVAGILFLIHGDTLYYKFNASNDLSQRPNDLLVWHGIRTGRALGLASLDFGVSDLDQPGLVRFKRKFATQELPLVELRRRPEGHHDRCAEQGQQVLRRLTQILTAPQVPDDVVRAVGDEVYRFFG